MRSSLAGLGLTGDSSDEVCATDAENSAWCWGQQAAAPLPGSAVPEMQAVPTPRQSAPGRRWAQLATGAGGAICGIEVFGNMSFPDSPDDPPPSFEVRGAHCWGSGRAGLFSTASGAAFSADPVKVPLPPPAGEPWGLGAILVGPTVACAAGVSSHIEPLGATYCWGTNTFGEVWANGSVSGPGHPVLQPHGLPIRRSITAPMGWVALGDGFACLWAESIAVGPVENYTVDWIVRCWGRNDKMQLGVASPNVSASPVNLTIPNGGICIDNGAPHPLACGTEACCTVTVQDSAVYCWGSAFSTAANPGPKRVPGGIPFASVSAPNGSSATLMMGGIGEQSMLSTMLLVGRLSAGRSSLCMQPELPADEGGDQIYCLGDNSWGQLGNCEVEPAFVAEVSEVLAPGTPE
ncbi:hypothetical protein ABPG75_009283 [Micractinium tetrahymenae]